MFLIGSVAIGSLRNRNALPRVHDLILALAKFVECVHETNRLHETKLYRSCSVHLFRVTSKLEEYVPVACRLIRTFAKENIMNHDCGMRPLIDAVMGELVGSISVRSAYFERFEMRKNSEVHQYNSK